ncbi:MAG: hypothetical protein AAFR21_05360 [Pseudomonadota bacterium]
MAQAEKYAWVSLITTGIIYWYFQMRMLDGWEVVDQSPSRLLWVFGTVVAMFIIAEGVVAGFLASKGSDGEIEKDERDLDIDRRAEQNASWFTIAALNVLIFQLIAQDAFEGHSFTRFDASSTSTLFFLLFSIVIISSIVHRISTLILYRRPLRSA